MDRKEIADIIINQKRTYIPEDDYRQFKKELVGDMLRLHIASDTNVTDMCNMLKKIDPIALKIIDLGEFQEIIEEINVERNEKTIARLSRTNFKSLGGMNE